MSIIICPHCGYMTEQEVRECPSCHQKIGGVSEKIIENERRKNKEKELEELKEAGRPSGIDMTWPHKSKGVAIFLASILGVLSIDEFYLGIEMKTIIIHLVLSVISSGSLGFIIGLWRAYKYISASDEEFQRKYHVIL